MSKAANPISGVMPRVEILMENVRTRIEMERLGTTVVFRTVGFIDEDVNFSVLLERMRALASEIDTVQFDLGSVTGLNSCGVREWIILMERMPNTLSRVFSKVCGTFIEQVNMVPSMLGRGAWKMLSFEAPYACGPCGKDYQTTLDPSMIKPKDGKFRAPAVNCPKCGCKMEFDWIEEEYFSFLERDVP